MALNRSREGEYLAEEFRTFAENCETISRTRSKNEKIGILAEYLKGLSDDSLKIAVLLYSGRIFPPESRLLVNISYSTITTVLSEIAHLEKEEINRIYLQHGDLGSLAEYALSHKSVTSLIEYTPLTLTEVYASLTKVAMMAGKSSQAYRKKSLSGLFLRCSPPEGKFLSKILTGELRIGLSEGLLLASIASAFGSNLDSIQDAVLMNGNLPQISLLAKKKLLTNAKMRSLAPVSYMLADVMYSAKEIAGYFGKDLIAEYKYDGIRAQVHLSGNKIKIFSRNLNDITLYFPELAQSKSLNNIGVSEVIFDGEILAYKNEKVLPFQYLQKRLHSKNLSTENLGSIPVIFTIFDILFIDKDCTNLSLIDRKKILSNLRIQHPFVLAKWNLVKDEETTSRLFNESKALGYEGLVLKDPESEYKIGKRGRKWVKLKTELDTLDVVIVIAEYGHGKRAGMLSDYTFAIKGPDESKLLTIGKAYSGLSDKEIQDLTSELKSIALNGDGYRVWVKPKIVLEVSFDSIQKSTRHESGFALRFPRIKAIRRDKGVKQIDNLDKVVQINARQIHAQE
jgi:DNA ligase-1